jgi:hypothetical protein
MVSVNKGNWDQSKGLDKDLEFHIEWIKVCRRVLISGNYIGCYKVSQTECRNV